MNIRFVTGTALALAAISVAGCSDDQSRTQIREMQARMEKIDEERQTSNTTLQDIRGEMITMNKQYEISQQQLGKLRQEIYSGAGQRGDPAHLIPYLNHSDKELVSVCGVR